jgi:hypothetical protein
MHKMLLKKKRRSPKYKHTNITANIALDKLSGISQRFGKRCSYHLQGECIWEYRWEAGER